MKPALPQVSVLSEAPAETAASVLLGGRSGWARAATEARALVATARPSQWPKNAFVLAPLFFSRHFLDAALLIEVSLGLVVFCLSSSAVYIFNDLLDIENDRRHPRKRYRPLAAGELSAATASWAVVAFSTISVVAAYFLNPSFLAVIVAYLALNLLYTLRLKHVVILDVMCISAGFLLRVLGGSILAGVEPSHWLILCTLTLSAFLGFSKRRQELLVAGDNPSGNRVVLHLYRVGFLDQIISIVTSCTLLCYALYTVSDQTVARFGTTNLIYTFPFVLFGVLRYFYLTYNENGEDNPSLIVLRDKPLLMNGLIYAVVCGLVIY